MSSNQNIFKSSSLFFFGLFYNYKDVINNENASVSFYDGNNHEAYFTLFLKKSDRSSLNPNAPIFISRYPNHKFEQLQQTIQASPFIHVTPPEILHSSPYVQFLPPLSSVRCPVNLYPSYNIQSATGSPSYLLNCIPDYSTQTSSRLEPNYRVPSNYGMYLYTPNISNENPVNQQNFESCQNYVARAKFNAPTKNVYQHQFISHSESAATAALAADDKYKSKLEELLISKSVNLMLSTWSIKTDIWNSQSPAENVSIQSASEKTFVGVKGLINTYDIRI